MCHFSGVSAKTKVTCENENIQTIECNVISVDSALYGRADRNTCSQGRPFWQLFNTGCSQSVTSFSFHRCELKQKCEVRMSDVRNPDPCWGTFKYLQTDFTCLAAEVDITCENDKAKLHCGNEVISADSALYGRADRNTCSQNRPSGQLADTSCSQSGTLGFIKDRCEMKQKCEVRMSDVRNPDPCRGTFKYLQTDFTCLAAGK
uniref:SUEL-type lectin domain-containing protein n=1 Tax=Oryzias latipes TaxID=8090 RepID=H2LB88_ORYLA